MNNFESIPLFTQFRSYYIGLNFMTIAYDSTLHNFWLSMAKLQRHEYKFKSTLILYNCF